MAILLPRDAIAKRIRAVARVRTELVREASLNGSFDLTAVVSVDAHHS